MSLPAGATDYLYVGSDAGGHPLTSISWPEDLSVVAGYSGNKSISIGRSASDQGSFDSNGATNVAIAGLAVTGYSVVDTTSQSTPSGTTLVLPFSIPNPGPVVLMVGGEGTGLLQIQGTPMTPLVDVTYSECGSNVIASIGMFAASLPAGHYSVTVTSTTYGSNSGASLGAVASLLTPRAVPSVQPGTASPSTPASSPVTTTVTVDPNEKWNDTGIALTADKHVTITATGTITLDVNQDLPVHPYSSPVGWPWDSTQTQFPNDNTCPDSASVFAGDILASGLPCFSLIAKVGPGGSPFEIGDSQSFAAPDNGELFLGYNAWYWGSEGGGYAAAISVG